MAKVNKSQFAILGMLSLYPMSGYEIRRSMEKSTNNFWKESDGQLYPSLEKLVNERKINCQGVRKHGARESKIYELTPLGKEALEQWLLDPECVSSVRSEFMLKVFFGANVSPEVTRELIMNFRQQQKQQLLTLQQAKTEVQQVQECASKAHKPYWEICIRLGELRLQSSLQWCDEALALLPDKAEKN